MSEAEIAAMLLGFAALDLDNVVREYHLGRRMKGVDEDHLNEGFGSGKVRKAALDKVDTYMKALRREMRQSGPV